MTKKLLKFSLILVLLVSFASCKENITRKDKVAAMIGSMDSPFFVAAFTPENLIEKSGVREGALPLTYETFISFLFLETATGIDNNAQVQLSATKGEWMTPNVHAFIPLKDAKKFEDIVKKELGAKIQEKDGVKFFRKDSDNYVAAWKEDLLVVTNVPFNLENIFTKSANDSKKAAVRLVNMINGVNVDNINENYRNFLDKEGDVITYFHGQSAYEMLSRIKLIPASNKKEAKFLLLGTTVEAALTFNKGSIHLKSDYFLSDSLKERLKFMKGEGVDSDLLAFSKTGKPELAFSFNVPSDGMIDFMRQNRNLFELDELERGLEESGLSLDKVEAAFTGSFLMMMEGVEKREYTYHSFNGAEKTETHKEPSVGMVFGLKDKQIAEEFIATLNDTEEELPEFKPSNPMKFIIRGDQLFVTNSEKWADLVESGKTVMIQDKEKVLTSNSFGMLANRIKDDWTDGMDDEFIIIAEEFSNAWATAGVDNAEFEIVMDNIGQNALRTLLEVLITEIEKSQESENEELKALLDEEVLESLIEEGVETLEEDLSDIFN